MDDWYVIIAEGPQNNSISYVHVIFEQGFPALEKVDNKLFFGIRDAMVKVLSPSG